MPPAESVMAQRSEVWDCAQICPAATVTASENMNAQHLSLSIGALLKFEIGSAFRGAKPVSRQGRQSIQPG
jgi:hypothetical protein